MMKMRFKDYDELTEKAIEMLDELFGDDIADVTFVCKYNHARKIIESLIKKDCKIENIELHSTDFDNYYDEYYCTILNIDDNIQLWCEPAKRDDKYVTDESDIVFIVGKCSDECIAALNCKIKFIAELDELNRCEKEDEEESTDVTNDAVHVAKDADGNPIGFSRTWFSTDDGVECYSSFSHYSSDFERLKEVADGFGIEL